MVDVLGYPKKSILLNLEIKNFHYGATSKLILSFNERE